VCAIALGAWLERRRSARIAREQLSAMSERELRDIGMSRADIDRVASSQAKPMNSFRID
jgi:uncharacterized protein YjiS (DUF1127 family)